MTLLERCIAICDLQYLGDRLWHWTGGMGATLGEAWPGLSGQYNLCRGEGAEAIDFANPVGATSPTAADPLALRLYPTWQQKASTRYTYAMRAIGPGGVESIDVPASPPIVVRTDADAEVVGPLPPSPRRQGAQPRAAGMLLVRWDYLRTSELTPATQFRIYSDAGTGVMDYITPEATIAARKGQAGEGLYQVEVGPFGHGLTVQVVVRSVSAAGVEDLNEVTISAIADAEGPAAHQVDSLAYGVDE